MLPYFKGDFNFQDFCLGYLVYLVSLVSLASLVSLVYLIETYQLMVFFKPSLKGVWALNPNSVSALLVSSIRLGWPSGIPRLFGLFSLSRFFGFYSFFSSRFNVQCLTYQSIVFFKPISKGVIALNLNSLSAFVVFSIRLGWPSGLVVFQKI